MANKKKKPVVRARTARRQAARAAERFLAARRKLSALERGGDIDHPIELAAMSQMDGAVRELPCVACGAASMSIEREVGSVRAGRVVRTVDLSCRRCGEARTIFFGLRPPSN